MKTNKSSGASRAIAILHWFSSNNGPLSATTLSAELGIPQATTYRILRDLNEWSVVEYNPKTKEYNLGARVLEFAKTYNQSTNLTAISRPHIRKLRDQTKETVSLNILLGTERICIDEARSPHGLNWAVSPGTRGPLFAGSTGKAILAFIEPEIFRSIKKSISLKPYTENTPKNWRELEKDLKRVKEIGYSITIGEVTDGVAGLAAPILNYHCYSVGSINLSAPLIRWNDEVAEEYIPLIINAAQAITYEFSGN